MEKKQHDEILSLILTSLANYIGDTGVPKHELVGILEEIKFAMLEKKQ